MKISPAKAQRRKALPRFLGSSLRRCAVAGEIFFGHDEYEASIYSSHPRHGA